MFVKEGEMLFRFRGLVYTKEYAATIVSSIQRKSRLQNRGRLKNYDCSNARS